MKFITEDLEMYFQRKLLALAFGETQNLHVTARCFGRNASTIPVDNITRPRDIEILFILMLQAERTRLSLNKLTPV